MRAAEMLNCRRSRLGRLLSMTADKPTEEDVLQMLAAMQPPTIPDAVFRAEHPDVMACRHWHRQTAAALLSKIAASVVPANIRPRFL
jgi:hypothetical protein